MLGTPGTLIHGTARSEDLIPAFLSEYLRLSEDDHTSDCPQAEWLIGEARACIENVSHLPDEASEVVCALMDALSCYAPEGYYFGSHPGDGCDYGFWGR